MPLETKDKIIHLSIGSVVAALIILVGILTGVLSFGRSAGGFESKIESHEKWIEEADPLIRRVPVIEEAVTTLKEDVRYTRQGVDEIKGLILKKN